MFADLRSGERSGAVLQCLPEPRLVGPVVALAHGPDRLPAAELAEHLERMIHRVRWHNKPIYCNVLRSKQTVSVSFGRNFTGLPRLGVAYNALWDCSTFVRLGADFTLSC